MRTAPFALVGCLALAALATPASAASKKPPITKSYDITVTAADPSNVVDNQTNSGYSVCAQRVPGAFQIKEFKAPALGKTKFKLTGFTGDWDLLVMDSKNAEVASGGSSAINTPDAPDAGDESTSAKVKKANTLYKVVACNFSGGTTGKLTITFDYA
jgi:hypothetical protein